MNTELKKQEHAPQAEEVSYRRPRYTVNGNKEHYTVSVWMPGVAKDDYTVSLEGKELVVEGRKVIPLPGGAKWLHREIPAESYKLRLQLNVDIDADHITARSEEGVLHVQLPVARAARPRLIKID